jgi:hypothetical protein
MIAVRLLRNLTSINNEELGAYRCPLTDLEGSPRSVGEGAKQSFQSGGAAVFWKILRAAGQRRRRGNVARQPLVSADYQIAVR